MVHAGLGDDHVDLGDGSDLGYLEGGDDTGDKVNCGAGFDHAVVDRGDRVYFCAVVSYR